MSPSTADLASEQTTLDEIVKTSTIELLGAYGVSAQVAEHTSKETAALGFAGIIGFTGEALRGTLLVTTTNTTLEQSNPIAGSPLREWMAELANQLLGRIKNQLLACGVEINLTTPLVLRGQHLSLESLRNASPIEMVTKGGPILVSLESESEAGLTLVRQPKAHVGVEGESFLF